MRTIKLWVKPVVLFTFAAYAWVRLRIRRHPVLIILTYHRILPESHPARDQEQPGMVASPATLNRQIGLLKSLGAQPVFLDEWIEKKRKGESLPSLSFAVTFDDGWRDNFQYAMGVLEERGCPATVFLVTRYIGTHQVFWPERLFQLLSRPVETLPSALMDWLKPHAHDLPLGQRALRRDEIDCLIGRLKTLTDEAIYRELERSDTATHADDERAIVNLDEIEQMQASGNIRFGAHTRHHYRLNRLEKEDDLKSEVVGCLEDLQRMAIPHTGLFCYPNGDITAKGRALVVDHYSGACSTQTGWNDADCDRHALKRFNFHDGNGNTALKTLAAIGRGLF